MQRSTFLALGPLELFLEAGDDPLRTEIERLAWPAGTRVRGLHVSIRTRIEFSIAGYSTPGPAGDFTWAGPFGSRAWTAGLKGFWSAEGRGFESVSVRCFRPDPESCRLAVRGFVKLFVTEALARAGGMALHGAAIARREGAVVLLARAGGGKTTLTRTFGSSGALADDCCILVRHRKRLWVLPSPFPGREGTPVTGSPCPLWLVAELVKDRGAFFDHCSRREAVAAMVRHGLLSIKDRDGRQGLLDSAVLAASTVIAGRLELGLGQDPWKALLCGR